MTDANYLEYGSNALRVTNSFGDLLEFGSQNGYALGVIFAVFIVLFILFVVLVFFGRKILNVLGGFLK